MATLSHLMQGLTKKENHRNRLESLIELDGADKIVLSTAFLTSDGVFSLQKSLEKNKGKVDFYVGCRNGVTSLQGISRLIKMGISPILVDTGSNSFIFHPKVYFAQADNKAISIIGSANFTYGGLIKNLESSVVLELDYDKDDADRQYAAQLLESFEKLSSAFPENVFRVNTIEQAKLLFDEGRLVDEQVSKVMVKGKSRGRKQVAPPMRLEHDHVPVTSKGKNKIVGPQTDDQSETVVIQNKGLNLVEVWRSKALTNRDLNIQTGDRTHVTGSMLLKKGTYDVDQQLYFREDVFAELEWGPKDGKPDYFHYATTKFYFVIEGVDFGSYSLEMKHDTRTNTRTYEQRQPMTHLFWRDAKALVSNRNLLGKELRLMRVTDAPKEFLIEIE